MVARARGPIGFAEVGVAVPARSGAHRAGAIAVAVGRTDGVRRARRARLPFRQRRPERDAVSRRGGPVAPRRVRQLRAGGERRARSGPRRGHHEHRRPHHRHLHVRGAAGTSSPGRMDGGRGSGVEHRPAAISRWAAVRARQRVVGPRRDARRGAGTASRTADVGGRADAGVLAARADDHARDRLLAAGVALAVRASQPARRRSRNWGSVDCSPRIPSPKAPRPPTSSRMAASACGGGRRRASRSSPPIAFNTSRTAISSPRIPGSTRTSCGWVWRSAPARPADADPARAFCYSVLVHAAHSAALD